MAHPMNDELEFSKFVPPKCIKSNVMTITICKLIIVRRVQFSLCVLLLNCVPFTIDDCTGIIAI